MLLHNNDNNNDDDNNNNNDFLYSRRITYLGGQLIFHTVIRSIQTMFIIGLFWTLIYCKWCSVRREEKPVLAL